jgi:hypothetical protein
MSLEDGEKRGIAICVDCEEPYAASEKSDGTLLPIGSPNGCSCGGTVFEEIDSEVALEYDENARTSEGD